MPLDIRAHPANLTEWAPGQIRSRYDYDVGDHLISEILEAGELYFHQVAHMLRAGDIVYVTDAAGKRATLIVNWVDQVKRTVAFDLDISHDERPVVTAAYAVRWRGPRGGKFCVVNATGKVVARDCESREEAERRIANLVEARAA